MDDSIFTKIIKGEISAFKVYEDDTVLAFLDIHPKTTGHTLVITKQQIANIEELDSTVYGHLMEVVQLVAKQLKQTYNCPKIAIVCAGFDVPHVHVHVYPAYSTSDIPLKPSDVAQPDHITLQQTADLLRIT